MKWLPRSLAGQLLILLLLAVIAAHLIGVLIQHQWRSDTQVHPLSFRKIETRVVAAYRVAVTHAPMSASLLEAMSLPESRFRLAGSAMVTPGPMGPQEAALAERIRIRLNLPPGTPLRVRLQKVDPQGMTDGGNAPAWMAGVLDAGPAWALDIDMGLGDGQWLGSRHWPAMMDPHWASVLSFSLPVSVLPVTLIAFLFGRRIMRPLRILADAVERASRGEKVPPLPLEGPDGVREITVAFNDMQERLGRFVDDRTRMLADMGHDLRTPLTSLRIRAELVDDPALRQAMIQTLDEMGVMVRETLQFARDDSAHEPTQDVEIGALVGEVVVEQRALGRRIDWTPPPAIPYRCRPVGLKRALRNIIDNATRYGDARVRVSAGGPEQDLRIEVEDDGPGIDPELIDRAFEPFSRLEPARNHEEGGEVGLGLAIARNCVRAHGGEIHLRNRPQGGLRAVIVLPGLPRPGQPAPVRDESWRGMPGEA